MSAKVSTSSLHDRTSLSGITINYSKILGRGAYGEVHEADWMGVKVAAKTLHNLLLEEQTDWLRNGFREESIRLQQLKHPNIVACFGIVKDRRDRKEERLHIIMEILHESLNDLMSRTRGPFSVAQICIIGIDVSSALRFLHEGEQHVAHRDISPKNILLTRDGRAKISDLGVAKEIQQISKPISATMAPGNPKYMPKEALHGGHYTPCKLDIFSLGIVTLELFSGESADTTGIPDHEPCNSSPDKFTWISEEKRRGKCFQKLPKDSELTQLIIKSIHTNPEERHTACEFQRDLRVIQEQLPSDNLFKVYMTRMGTQRPDVAKKPNLADRNLPNDIKQTKVSVGSPSTGISNTTQPKKELQETKPKVLHGVSVLPTQPSKLSPAPYQKDDMQQTDEDDGYEYIDSVDQEHPNGKISEISHTEVTKTDFREANRPDPPNHSPHRPHKAHRESVITNSPAETRHIYVNWKNMNGISPSGSPQLTKHPARSDPISSGSPTTQTKLRQPSIPMYTQQLDAMSLNDQDNDLTSNTYEPVNPTVQEKLQTVLRVQKSQKGKKNTQSDKISCNAKELLVVIEENGKGSTMRVRNTKGEEGYISEDYVGPIRSILLEYPENNCGSINLGCGIINHIVSSKSLKKISITSSGISRGPVDNLLNIRDPGITVTKEDASSDSWFMWDFQVQRILAITGYMLICEGFGSFGFPCQWKVEASLDGSQWTIVSQGSGNSGEWPWVYRNAEIHKLARYTKITQIGKNSKSNMKFCLSGVEFYGQLYTTVDEEYSSLPLAKV